MSNSTQQSPQVNLQVAEPGIPQTGHSNIAGTQKAARQKIENNDVTRPISSMKAAPDIGGGPQVGNWTELLDEADVSQYEYNKDDRGFGFFNGFTFKQQYNVPSAPFSLKAASPSEPLTWVSHVKHKFSFSPYEQYWRMGTEAFGMDAVRWRLQKEDSFFATVENLLQYDGNDFDMVGNLHTTGSINVDEGLLVHGGLIGMFPFTNTDIYWETEPTGTDINDGAFYTLCHGNWYFSYLTFPQPTGTLDTIGMGAGVELTDPTSAEFFIGYPGSIRTYWTQDAMQTMLATGGLTWTDAVYPTGARAGTKDTGIVRSIAGEVKVTDGGAGVGDMLLKFLTMSGGLHLLGYVSSVTAPTTTELPTDKDIAIHKDTVLGTVRLSYNDGGTIKSTILA